MTEALVNPEVLQWARRRAGLTADALAVKLGAEPDRIAAWEAGEARPSFRQAERLAQATHVPFGYLFLPEPPEERLPIPDLRTATGSPPPRLDADFMDVLEDVRFELDWFRDHLKEQGHEPLAFVGRFAPPVAPSVVAEDIRRTLGVDASTRDQVRSWEDHLRMLVSRAEAAGVWIMRNGVVKGNTHRPLKVEIFRGFAIADPLAPLVFINGRDAKAAQIFTLAHELAHLWLGQSGISDPLQTNPGGDGRRGGVEDLCNAIAAEFLVPRAEFLPDWDKTVPLEANVQRLSARFRVSRIVIAIRARDLGLIDRTSFDAFFQAERRQWQRERSEGEGGGDYYRTAKARNGERFLKTVLASAMSGRLLLRDAGALLRMTPRNLQETYRRVQEGRL